MKNDFLSIYFLFNFLNQILERQFNFESQPACKQEIHSKLQAHLSQQSVYHGVINSIW
jgi:hypothetical protein